MSQKLFPAQSSDENGFFSKLNRLNSLLSELDERGLILSLASFSEEALGELIGAFLISASSTEALLYGFNAPLGTLSARIKMTHSLGLITQEQFDDLEVLRKIRNEFSHTWEPISFSDSKIRALVERLNYNLLDDEFPDSPLKKVRASLGFLVVELSVAVDQISKRDKRLKVSGSRLIAGQQGTTDEQIARCKEKFQELSENIENSGPERRAFLIGRWDAWLFKLKLAGIDAPLDKYEEIQELHKFFTAQKPSEKPK